MIATMPLPTLRPSIVSEPWVSLFTGTLGRSRKSAESTYQSRSPLASRRSGNPKVRNGSRPVRVTGPEQSPSR